MMTVSGWGSFSEWTERTEFGKETKRWSDVYDMTCNISLFVESISVAKILEALCISNNGFNIKWRVIQIQYNLTKPKWKTRTKTKKCRCLSIFCPFDFFYCCCCLFFVCFFSALNQRISSLACQPSFLNKCSPHLVSMTHFILVSCYGNFLACLCLCVIRLRGSLVLCNTTSPLSSLASNHCCDMISAFLEIDTDARAL